MANVQSDWHPRIIFDVFLFLLLISEAGVLLSRIFAVLQHPLFLEHVLLLKA